MKSAVAAREAHARDAFTAADLAKTVWRRLEQAYSPAVHNIDGARGDLQTRLVYTFRRFAEAALQIRGQAGEHQVPDARTAVGHAYGGGSQFFAMWVVGSEKP